MSRSRPPAAGRGASRPPRRGRPDYAARRRRALAAAIAVLVVIAVVIILVAGGSGGGSAARRAADGTPSATGTSPTSARSTTTTTTTTSAARPRPRPAPTVHRVGIADLELLEPSSAATADAHLPDGAPARALPTRIRYPALGAASAPAAAGLAPDRSHGPYPLIVFSQGFNYPAEGYASLLDAWARAGYVVADPTYPRTDPDAPGGVDEDDILHHPADLSFTITRVLEATGAHGAGSLQGLVAPGAIAVAGQSDGGDVSLATAADSCCRDRRVRAAVILSGAELPAFGGRYYASGAPPLLVVQGDRDPINAPGCSAALYDGAPDPKYYVDLLGASHLPPYTEPGPWHTVVARAVVAFLDRYLKAQPGGLRRLARAAAVPGVASLTSAPQLAGAGTYCPPAGIP